MDKGLTGALQSYFDFGLRLCMSDLAFVEEVRGEQIDV